MQITSHATRVQPQEGPVLLINTFTPKEGQADAFIEVQISEYERLRGRIPGWIGNHLHQNLADNTVVNVATFESLSDYQSWRQGHSFQDHVKRLIPFVDKADPKLFGAPLYEARL